MQGSEQLLEASALVFDNRNRARERSALAGHEVCEKYCVSARLGHSEKWARPRADVKRWSSPGRADSAAPLRPVQA